MNSRDISSIRRRLTPDKNNITKLRGCYVSDSKEIITTFTREMVLMQEDESEKYLSVFKKTLSGTPGKNLIDIEFSTNQVLDSDEHRLLCRLRDSGLGDDDAVNEIFRKIIDNTVIEGGYLILLMHEVRDIALKNKNDDDTGESDTQFRYVLCSVCPVKMTKPQLAYRPSDNDFHPTHTDWIVASPEFGFMFPEFEDGGANIYQVLYYTRDVATERDELIASLFNTEKPLAADIQKEKFSSVLSDSLAEDCSFDVINSLNEQLCDVIADYKADRYNREPLAVTKGDVKGMLEGAGVKAEKLAVFSEKYDEEFGANKSLAPQNIIDEKKLELHTPEVVIKVAGGRSDLVETRVIDGISYVLVRADTGVELNGVNISIKE